METVTGRASVVGNTEAAGEAAATAMERLMGATVDYEGFEVGDQVEGWSGIYQVSVSAGFLTIIAVHEDEAAARAAAEAAAGVASD